MTYGIDTARQKCSRKGRMEYKESRCRTEAAALFQVDSGASTLRTAKALIKLAEAQTLRRLRRNSK